MAEKLFIVTGSTSGIGRAVSEKLLQDSANSVVGIGRNKDVLQALAQSGSPGTFCPCQFDLLQVDQIESVIADLVSQHGPVNGLVCSAGELRIAPLANEKPGKIQEFVQLNLLSSMEVVRCTTKKANRHASGMSVVLLSSIASLAGNPGLSVYAACKGAINSYVRVAATELARYGVRVNAVLPGTVRGEMVEKWRRVYTDKYLADADKRYPLGLGEVGDVAEAILFLLSDNARWITGEGLRVDGGAHLVGG